MNFLGSLTSNKKLTDMASEYVSNFVAGEEGATNTDVHPSSVAGFKDGPPQVTGKRRALFIGINYTGTKAELAGCINDVKNVHGWLTKTASFQDILILTDDQQDSSKIPTKQNILNGFHWLTNDAQPGDSLFLHYSGHGSSQKDEGNDELDHCDETIVPLDYESSGLIVDDELHEQLVKNLPAGTKFTAIFDCCHSGSVLDLPFSYRLDGNLDVVMISNKKAAVKKGIEAGLNWFKGDKAGAIAGAKDAFSMYMKKSDNSSSHERIQKERSTQAFVVQFSGCDDSQTSADAKIQGVATGAMSWALLSVLGEHPTISYIELLKAVRTKLQGKYTQIPQISTGYPISLSSTFSI